MKKRTLKSDTVLLKKAAMQWIEKSYKNTVHLALYYLQQHQREKDALAGKQPSSTQAESLSSHTAQELEEVD